MTNLLKKLIPFIRFSFLSLAITSFLAHSYFNSNNFSIHELLNSKFHEYLYSSHLNDHHTSHDTYDDTNDDHEDHVHKHRHSENEEEHSHTHLNFISSAEIIIHDIAYALLTPQEKHSVVYFDYGIKSYDSYILELLKPPIFT